MFALIWFGLFTLGIALALATDAAVALLPVAMLIMALFFTSLYFTFADCFVATADNSEDTHHDPT